MKDAQKTLGDEDGARPGVEERAPQPRDCLGLRARTRRRVARGQHHPVGVQPEPHDLAGHQQPVALLVRRVGRLVVVEEAPATCSAAAEIAALIVEDPETFRAPKALVRRVCAAPVPVPYTPPLEQAALPSRDDVKTAVTTP